MIRKTLVSLVALMAILAVTAGASQIDNEYVYTISRALFENYTFTQLDDFHEQDVIHAAKKLGFDRELSEAEVVKLRCIIGAIEMPHVSPLWHGDVTPTPTGKPARPQITLGKVDGSNAFDLVWNNDGVADSAKNAISDIAVTSPSNDLDQDGKPEIVVTCKLHTLSSPPYSYVSRVIVFENTADNTFSQVWFHDFTQNYAAAADTQHTRVTRVELGDLDGDGDLEIICGVRCQIYAKTDYGCIRVFNWDGVPGSDNYGTQPASTYDLNKTGAQWATAMAVGNIDDDANLELVVGENVANYGYVLDVTGNFGTAVTWNQEYCDSIGAGSPYAACIGDADGDGAMEFYITRWWDVRLHTYEYDSVGDSIIHYGYIQVESSGDHYSWEGTKIANFDGDAYSEVYMTARSGNLWVFTNTGDVSTATKHLLYSAGSALYGGVVGDQDHGPGSDGGDLYCVSGTNVYDFEFTGSDVTNPSDYTLYTIFQETSTNFLMVGAGDSLDLDGEHEVVAGQDEWSDTTRVLYVLEHGEFAAHDVGTQTISPTYSTVGQNNVQANIKNFGANDEDDFYVYWETDTGDTGSYFYDDTLPFQQDDDVLLGWIPDTTGLVNMTVWTDLAGDENASNDTLSRNIFVYPPESGQYSYEYTTESSNRVRGIGVFGNDDFCVGVKNSPYSLEFYHSAPDSPDVIVTYWENPGDPGDHIDLIWSWGIGIDSDLNAYLTNQDLMQSVLVFDYDGNSTVHRLELGQDVTPLGTGYPTACDIDDSGYVYVAYYMYNPAGEGNGDQIEVYDKLANWNDATHTAPLMTSFEPAAYVCEGMCVNGDGSVIWVTNRSDYGYAGNVTRWTGSPTTGYTQDTTFAGDGTMEVPGRVRGIDLAPDGDIYVISDVNVEFAGDKVLIADGTTGVLEATVDVDSPTGDHNDPYDIEFSLVGEIDLSAGRAGETPPFDDDIYLSWSLPTATALYVTHQYGWYVDKWEGPGFKGVSSYAVYRDTLPDFVPGPGNLLGTTPNSYYLDETGAGNTSLNYYYIVKATGTPGYTSKSTTAGEFDKSLLEVKKKGAPQRTVTKSKTR